MGQEARANQLCAIEQGDDDAAVTSCPPSKQASKPISWSWTRWREMIIVAEQRRAAERERERRGGFAYDWLIMHQNARRETLWVDFPLCLLQMTYSYPCFAFETKKKKKETKTMGNFKWVGHYAHRQEGIVWVNDWTQINSKWGRDTPLSLSRSLGLSVRMR